ncbi:MAG: DoxX family protein [Balneolaceae bacterium]|nr:MAG: DoxX family protein [Balneolaceae bacterium]
MLTFNTDKYKDLAPLLLRIGVGLIFIVAGWGKLNGIDGTAEFFGNIGIPLPVIMAWVVAIVEFVGGIMVLAGYRIQLPALLLAFTMLVAIITTKLGGDDVFRAMRLDLMLLLASLALMFIGSGSYSADSLLGKKES